ncbi:glycoside hydrolase family 5 protein [Clostridium butyricum]
MYINGVNLGNWLVLEKWMSPTLFYGTDAEDEYYLPRRLSKDVYESRIKIHRSEYVTERDFAYIKSLGFNSVRIPVPYFIFGDCKPFIACTEELDKAFNWAEKYDLSILIDLHTVPGSQNGFDNGGISGVCKWAKEPESVKFTLSVLERLAIRYGDRKGLMGIEILNEPLTPKLWDMFDIKNRYKAVDEKMAEESGPVSLEFLREFYVDAYRIIRKHMKEDKYVVFHDGFDLKAWKDFMREDEFKNVILDTHQYLMTAECNKCEKNLESYVKYIKENYEKDIEEMREYFPIICGEWSLFNSYGTGVDTQGGQSPLNGINADKDVISKEQKEILYSTIAESQLNAWKKCNGHYYWNYKLLLDTVNEKGWIGWDSWDLGKSVAQGWYPIEKRSVNFND